MSISEWLGPRKGTPVNSDDLTRLPHTTDIPRTTDAEFAAEAAARALQEGRYDLGRSLADLAARASRMQATAIPRMLPTVERPGQSADSYAAGPTGNGDQDLRTARIQANTFEEAGAPWSTQEIDTETEVLRTHVDAYGVQRAQDAIAREAVARGARCATEVGHGAYLEPCQRPVYWTEGNMGDPTRPDRPGGWYHVDPAVDKDHLPTVDPGAH